MDYDNSFSPEVQEMVDKVQNCAITVAILNYLNNEAIERNFNRQIREGFLDVSKPPTKEDIEQYGAEMCNQVADDRFPVIVKLAMPHYWKQGIPSELHFRLMVEVVVKNLDGTEPDKKYASLFVDVTKEAFGMLPNIPSLTWLNEVANTTDEFFKEWSEKDTDQMTKDFIDEIETMLNSSAEGEEE